MSKLVIIGGAMKNVDEIYRKIVELSGGTGSKIGLIPLAGSRPYEAWSKDEAKFKQHGAKPILIDITEKNYRTNAYSKKIVKEIERLDGIFFMGGAQRRIIKGLIDEKGNETPALKAIRKIHQEGKLIAGNSAGAAVLSNPMIYEGMDMKVEVGRGLGFFMNGKAIIDQHFIQRRRLPRLIEALWKTNVNLGIGIDEETALIVEGENGEVIGNSSIIILKRTGEKNFKLSYLSRGDKINLKTLTAKICGEKREVEAEEENGKHYIIDIASPRGIYTALTKLAETKNAEIEGYIIRIIGKEEEKRIGYAYKVKLEKTSETKFYQDKDKFKTYQRISALNVEMQVEKVGLEIKLTDYKSYAIK